MNKRGQFEVARKTIYWMMAGLVIAIVMIAFAMIMAGYRNKLTKVPEELRAELMVLRFLNNPDCFAYEGEIDEKTRRVYPGVIDLEKFKEEVLLRCYHTEKEKGFKDYNFRLVLVGKAKEIKTNNYFHHDRFTLFKEVLVREGEKISPDELRIHVQVKV